MGANMASNIDQTAPKIAKHLIVQRHLRDPYLHETMVITVPLGHRGFSKVICSMESGSSAVLAAFLCALFFTIFLSLFHKTLVNAQPLSPPFL